MSRVTDADELREDYANLLRAMLEAYKAHEAAQQAARAAWDAFLRAQSAFTGKFATTDHPLGPFVVGNTLVEHHPNRDTWPESTEQFRCRKVIRCRTSE